MPVEQDVNRADAVSRYERIDNVLCENKINFLCIVVRIFITLIRRDAIFSGTLKSLLRMNLNTYSCIIGE